MYECIQKEVESCLLVFVTDLNGMNEKEQLGLAQYVYLYLFSNSSIPILILRRQIDTIPRISHPAR